ERERVVAGSPSQAVRNSGRLGLLAALILGLSFALAFGLAWGPGIGPTIGPTIGLALGLVFGLAFGLDTIAFHYAFRLWLRMHRLGPWDWPAFLHWASDRLLLPTTGASYQWIHLELRDY